jgi:hypothetical protein
LEKIEVEAEVEVEVEVEVEAEVEVEVEVEVEAEVEVEVEVEVQGDQMVQENNSNAVITLEVEAGGSHGYYDQNNGTLSRRNGIQWFSTERGCITSMITFAVLFGICLIFLIYDLAIYGGRVFRDGTYIFWVVDLLFPLLFGVLFGISFCQLSKHRRNKGNTVVTETLIEPRGVVVHNNAPPTGMSH